MRLGRREGREKSNKNVKIRLLFSETETAKQNQKFPFHCLGRFAVEGWGEETREKCKEIFWFLHTRVRERVRGALCCFTTQSERTRQFQATMRSARAIQSSSGFSSKYIRTLFNTHRNRLVRTVSPSDVPLREGERFERRSLYRGSARWRVGVEST